MVQTLLDYQWSLRKGEWDLHLRLTIVTRNGKKVSVSCDYGVTEKMLPWFHAYDYFNYARHFTYYWCTQQNLEGTHPGLRQAYLN